MKTFDVYSGNIRISDPCYTNSVAFDAKNNIAKILTLKAKKGRWVAEVEKEERVVQDVVKTLVVYHDQKQSEIAGLVDMDGDFNKTLAMMMGKDATQVTKIDQVVTIESGVVGIFDNKSYRDNKIASRTTRLSEKIVCEDEPWYSICCDRVLTEDQWGTIPNGCVSSSSVEGDVSITTYVNASSEVVKVEINFENKVETSAYPSGDDACEYEEEEDEEKDEED